MTVAVECGRASEPRAYHKQKADYWEEGIYIKKKRNVSQESETIPQQSPTADLNYVSPQPSVPTTLVSVDFARMTVPQLKQELKRRRITGI